MCSGGARRQRQISSTPADFAARLEARDGERDPNGSHDVKHFFRGLRYLIPITIDDNVFAGWKSTEPAHARDSHSWPRARLVQRSCSAVRPRYVRVLAGGVPGRSAAFLYTHTMPARTARRMSGRLGGPASDNSHLSDAGKKGSAEGAAFPSTGTTAPRCGSGPVSVYGNTAPHLACYEASSSGQSRAASASSEKVCSSQRPAAKWP